MPSCDVPLTAVMFWMDEVLAGLMEQDQKMGERARKELEKIVHQALIDNGIYETDNSGGSIVGVSDSPFAVVNCCVAVRKAVSELRLQSAGPEAEPVPVKPISMGVATDCARWRW
eukprot:gene660-biopygen556